MSVNEKMTAIADAIRDKTGGVEPLGLDDMATEIPKVYEAGQQYTSDEFWNIITKHGTRLSYQGAFCQWDVEYVRPIIGGQPLKIQPISSGSANQTFSHNLSLKAIESKYFDFSKIQNGVSSANSFGYYYTWYNCRTLVEVQDIGIGKEIYLPAYVYTWANCYELKYIRGMKFDENTKFDNAFTNCNALEELVINEGSVIGQSGFNLKSSKKLSKASIENVFEALSTETSGLSITLSKTAVNDAFGINVSDPTTFPEGSEYYNLLNSRRNWTINHG